jgi:uncharacterized protein YbgA (DUF1722 family)
LQANRQMIDGIYLLRHQMVRHNHRPLASKLTFNAAPEKLETRAALQLALSIVSEFFL